MNRLNNASRKLQIRDQWYIIVNRLSPNEIVVVQFFFFNIFRDIDDKINEAVGDIRKSIRLFLFQWLVEHLSVNPVGFHKFRCSSGCIELKAHLGKDA